MGRGRGTTNAQITVDQNYYSCILAYETVLLGEMFLTVEMIVMPLLLGLKSPRTA
jgi:hypothetical protein